MAAVTSEVTAVAAIAVKTTGSYVMQIRINTMQQCSNGARRQAGPSSAVDAVGAVARVEDSLLPFNLPEWFDRRGDAIATALRRQRKTRTFAVIFCRQHSVTPAQRLTENRNICGCQCHCSVLKFTTHHELNVLHCTVIVLSRILFKPLNVIKPRESQNWEI